MGHRKKSFGLIIKNGNIGELNLIVQQALDIYIKLLIAIISFIAPLLINLLSIFSDGVAVKKRNLNEFETQTANLLKEKINADGANVAKLFTENSDVFKKKADDSNRQLDLLDPKKQVLVIFPTFFYSLLLIIANGFICDSMTSKVIKADIIRWCSVATIIGSVLFAAYGIRTLKSIFWAIIEVKQEIAQEEERKQSKSETINPI